MPSFTLVPSPPSPAVPQYATDAALVLVADVNNPIVGDLALGANGSLYLLTALADQVLQGISIRCRFFLGEWFLDETQGVPYVQRVFVKAPSTSVLNVIFRAIIGGTQGVQSITKLTFDLARDVRELRVNFVAKLIDGSILPDSFKPFVIPNLDATGSQ